MSNFLAIASVTAAFRRLVLESVQVDVAGATVSTLRPGEPGPASGIPALGVNLYLYQVAPIPQLRNAHLPARRNGGSIIQRPATALELDYLLSFYGDDGQYEPQRLLGSTVAKLAAEPLITKKRINDTITDTDRPYLADSDIGDQVDSIKFTPLNLSLEEMSRIWSVFFQVRHTLSVVYRASAVVVEPQLDTSPSLPVREPLLYTQPIRLPVVSRVVAIPNEFAPILPGSNIAILGERLSADTMEVLIDGNLVAPTLKRDERLELNLPGALRAGAKRLQVRHLLPMGKPAEPRPAYQSNLAEFLLHPVIKKTAGNYEIVLSNRSGSGSSPRSADVAITLTAAIASKQQVTLELLRQGQVVQTVFAKARNDDSAAVSFAVTNMPPATYVARVRVDRAESPMDIDNTPGSPTAGQSIAPVIDLS